MTTLVRCAAVAAAAGFSTLVSPSVMAQSYPIDCAILLCLAGGWPASAPCVEAQAEFIRRITTWPIEPPLQIWRCPMAASLQNEPADSAWARVYDVSFRGSSPAGLLSPITEVIPVQSGEQADIDISGDAFDFIRSIRVFDIQYSQREALDGDCARFDSTRLGTYGTQGDFHWADSSISQIPPAASFDPPGNCIWVNYRAVFVDWRDQTGRYGFEEVHY